MALQIDVQQGWHDAVVELFDIDLSPITGDVNDVYYFTDQTKPDGSEIVWQGRAYEALPILSTGYETNTAGTIAQPTLTVANVLGTFSELAGEYDDLVGAKVTRRRTLAKYLDGEPSADPLQELPIDIYYIERKTEETALSISWSLASILDLEGLKLPRRIITQNLCLWKYRGSECGYTGPPLFDVRDGVLPTAGMSAEAVTLINTYQTKEVKYNEWQAAISVRNKAFEKYSQDCSLYTALSQTYNLSSGTYVLDNIAYLNNTVISLGATYRVGKQRQYVGGRRYYELELWGESAAACTASTNAYNDAQTAEAAAEAAYNTALSNYNAAVAALPEDDALWSLDICGKRTASCKLRFPRQSIPFGGFPGASLKQ